MLSWPEVNVPVRVIRSLETYAVRRQLDHKNELLTSDWVWATTLPSAQVSTERCVAFGHQRWDIENQGFNELVNGWHADHIYKHDPTAMECFLLRTFLSFILYHAFLFLNLKPALRHGKSKEFWTKLTAAEIYAGLTPVAQPHNPATGADRGRDRCRARCPAGRGDPCRRARPPQDFRVYRHARC